MADDSNYGIAEVPDQASGQIPDLPYRPSPPKWKPKIALVGAGGIAHHHLDAYRTHDLEVVVIADLNLDAARHRRDEYFPDAHITTDASEVFRRDDVEIVDLATHPGPRVALMEQALEARKHVLSQKPFVSDLDVGERLCDLADAKGVQLAVNQNGRWAPGYRYLAEVIRAGLLGDVSSIDFVQQWDHGWTAGGPFDEIHHLLLYDFGIHWFDFANMYTGSQQAEKIYASVRHTSYQKGKPPYLATVVIDFQTIQVRIALNASVRYGQEDRVIISGEHGTARSVGEGYNVQNVFLETETVSGSPKLQGTWFKEGFEGTMMELINAIAEERVSEVNARNNLHSLAMCYAALKSADTGEPQVPGQVRRMEG